MELEKKPLPWEAFTKKTFFIIAASSFSVIVWHDTTASRVLQQKMLQKRIFFSLLITYGISLASIGYQASAGAEVYKSLDRRQGYVVRYQYKDVENCLEK